MQQSSHYFTNSCWQRSKYILLLQIHKFTNLKVQPSLSYIQT